MLRLPWAYLYTASNVTFGSLAKANRRRFMLLGADSSFYLPISLWILLQYWQTDSPALWGDRSPPSAGYHFQLNPFI